MLRCHSGDMVLPKDDFGHGGSGEAPMGAVMIRCPRTGRAISTEIETEPQVFSRLPTVEARLICPECGEEHVWTARDAWLAEPVLAPEEGEPAAASDPEIPGAVP